MNKDTTSAFPFGQVSELTGQPINGFFSPGMTLRDWFAGQALPAGISDAEKWNDERIRDGSKTRITPEDVAERCYKYADAMTMERLK